MNQITNCAERRGESKNKENKRGDTKRKKKKEGKMPSSAAPTIKTDKVLIRK